MVPVRPPAPGRAGPAPSAPARSSPCSPPSPPRVPADSDHQRTSERRERHLAEGGLPEPPGPGNAAGQPGRPASAHPSTCSSISRRPSPRLTGSGIEAAAIGSGIADAWLSPGRAAADKPTAAAAGRPARHLTPVPAGGDARRRLGDRRQMPCRRHPGMSWSSRCWPASAARGRPRPTRHEAHLVLGRDGSWRAGPVTGAYQADDVTLIGASNRETARLVCARRHPPPAGQLVQQLRRSQSRSTQIDDSLTRLEAEQYRLPADDDVVSARRSSGPGRQADASRSASDLRALIAGSQIGPPPVTEPDGASAARAGLRSSQGPSARWRLDVRHSARKPHPP